jgi:hypothetical protein
MQKNPLGRGFSNISRRDFADCVKSAYRKTTATASADFGIYLVGLPDCAGNCVNGTDSGAGRAADTLVFIYHDSHERLASLCGAFLFQNVRFVFMPEVSHR